MALYRAFATVGAMTIWSRILGFIRDVLIAAVLGAGPVADAFFVAFRVPNLFRRLFAEGRLRRGLHPALRQALSRRGRRGSGARLRRAGPCRAHACPRRLHPPWRIRHALAHAAARAWLCRRPGQIRPRRPAGPHRAPLSALHVAGRALFGRAQRARPLCRRGLRPEPAQRRAHRRAAHADRHRRRRAEHGRGGARLGHRRVRRVAGDRRRRCRGEIEDAPLLSPAALRCRHAQAACPCRPCE